MFIRQSRFNSSNRMPILLYLIGLHFCIFHVPHSPRSAASHEVKNATIRFALAPCKRVWASGPCAFREQNPPHLPNRFSTCTKRTEMLRFHPSWHSLLSEVKSTRARQERPKIGWHGLLPYPLGTVTAFAYQRRL